MVVKYKNSLDDLVELNVFIGSISAKRWLINNIVPLVYTIITLIVGGALITKYGGVKTINDLLIGVLVICNIFVWFRMIVFKRKNFKKSLAKMVEKNPAYIQKKAVTRREKEFFVQNLENKSKSVTFKVEDVMKIIKKDKYLYVLRKDKSPMFMFPSDIFKNEEEMKRFFEGLEVVAG